MGLTTQTKFFGLLFSFLLFLQFESLAEGTKEIMSTSSTPNRICLQKSYSNFAHYGAHKSSRLQITIKNTGEKIYFGVGQILTPQLFLFFTLYNPVKDVSFRLMRPDSTIAIASTPLPTSGVGFIDSYTKAINGPMQLTGSSSTGYNALEYTTNMIGDWYIEFDFPVWDSNELREFELFDITVAAGSTKKLGRVWSKSWQLTGSWNFFSSTYPFQGTLYTYSEDGFTTELKFNEFYPNVFNAFSNAIGVQNTGNFEEDAKSRSTKFNSPGYKVFLNNPDPLVFPSGSLGDVSGTITTLGQCTGETDISFNITSKGRVELTIQIDPAIGIQPIDRIIYSNVNTGINTIHWDGLNGLGAPLQNGTIVNFYLTYYNGLTNFPIWDPDQNGTGFYITSTNPTWNPINIFWNDQLIGGNSQLLGCNSSPLTGCHDFGSSVGNNKTVNTWWYFKKTTKGPIPYRYRHHTTGLSSLSMCDGDSILFNGTYLKHDGIYNAIFPSKLTSCDSAHSLTIILKPQPIGSGTYSIESCNTSPIIIGPDPIAGLTYSWNSGQTTSKIQTTSSGNYILIVKGDNGCSSLLNYNIILNSPFPIAPIEHY